MNKTKLGQACHIDCIAELADILFQKVISSQYSPLHCSPENGGRDSPGSAACCGESHLLQLVHLHSDNNKMLGF